MSEDWLDTGEGARAVVPAVVDLPVAEPDRAVVVRECWARLTDQQRLFLTTLRQNGFNARKAARALEITGPSREAHIGWMHKPDYKAVFQAWRAWAAGEAKNPDHLLTRQDDIVETLLMPKPVLHQGIAVLDPRRPGENAILEEVEAGAASRANEVLMKAAGLLKDKSDVEVNVGVAVGYPDFTIPTTSRPANAEKGPVEVTLVLPEFVGDDMAQEWLDG